VLLRALWLAALPEALGSAVAESATDREPGGRALRLELMPVAAERARRWVGGFRNSQHLHELACLLFVHLTRSYTLFRARFHSHP
jgi:hypothetical protein